MYSGIHCSLAFVMIWHDFHFKEELYLIFLYTTYALIEHIHVNWFYSKHGCIYHKIKSDYPHHVIIKHRGECRMDSKASTVTSYTRFSNGHDVTLLALLSIRHMARCLIIVWWAKSLFHLILIHTVQPCFKWNQRTCV